MKANKEFESLPDRAVKVTENHTSGTRKCTLNMVGGKKPPLKLFVVGKKKLNPDEAGVVPRWRPGERGFTNE